MQENLGSWAVLLLLAAFAIERIIAAAGFLLGPKPAADDVKGLQRREVLLFGLAAAVALAIVNGSDEIRLLKHLQPGRPSTPYDYWLTWLVLVAGSEQVRSVIQWIGGSVEAALKEQKKETAPIIRVESDPGVSVRAA